MIVIRKSLGYFYEHDFTCVSVSAAFQPPPSFRHYVVVVHSAEQAFPTTGNSFRNSENEYLGSRRIEDNVLVESKCWNVDLLADLAEMTPVRVCIIDGPKCQHRTDAKLRLAHKKDDLLQGTL